MASTIELLNAASDAFWRNRPSAMLWQNTGQSIPNGTTFSTAVTWDSDLEDTWSGHSASSNPSRYTVPVGGTYLVGASLTYHNSSGLEVRAAALFKNGAQVNGVQAYNQSYSNNFCAVQLPCVPVPCAAGDYLEVYTWQNSGAALALQSTMSYMSITFSHF